MARGDYGQRVPPAGPPELARVSEGFNRMAAEVERSRQIVVRFVSTLSHELRTPLTSIRGFAQAVLDGSVASPDDLRRAMEIVEREARRMQRLAAELLDLSRLQAGQVPMRREALDLAALVRQSAEVLATRAQERGVQLDLELPLALPVDGDADRLEQVLTNLLENALKFTPPGRQVQVRGSLIERAVQRSGSPPKEHRLLGRPRTPALAPQRCVVVQIANPGPPIAPADLPRIFEEFYTGQEGKARGGSGLGLPIAREIARVHAGDVTVASEPDLTTFSLTLPAGSGRDASVTPPPLTAVGAG
jgi:signal transduction histidine kinase